MTDKSLKLIFLEAHVKRAVRRIYMCIELRTCAKEEKEKRHEITLSKRVTKIT